MQENNSYISNLVEDNLKLVSYVIKKYYPQHIADDDAFQCGCIGLMKAAENYDASKGAFSTYAALFIRGELHANIRYKYRAKRKGALETASLDFIVSEKGTQTMSMHEVCGVDGFEESIIDRFFIRELLSSTELNQLERQCIEMYYFQGLNQVEISKLIKKINISRVINTALKKLRVNALQYAS